MYPAKNVDDWSILAAPTYWLMGCTTTTWNVRRLLVYEKGNSQRDLLFSLAMHASMGALRSLSSCRSSPK